MDKMTKSAFLIAISERTDVTKKEAETTWNTIRDIAIEQLHGTGVVTLPGLIKFTIKDVPAQAKRTGKHPFTGKDHVFPAKPASKKLKVVVPKAFKDAALKK
jgi:nucleoid DNA-binding protein